MYLYGAVEPTKVLGFQARQIKSTSPKWPDNWLNSSGSTIQHN